MLEAEPAVSPAELASQSLPSLVPSSSEGTAQESLDSCYRWRSPGVARCLLAVFGQLVCRFVASNLYVAWAPPNADVAAVCQFVEPFEDPL